MSLARQTMLVNVRFYSFALKKYIESSYEHYNNLILSLGCVICSIEGNQLDREEYQIVFFPPPKTHFFVHACKYQGKNCVKKGTFRRKIR